MTEKPKPEKPRGPVIVEVAADGATPATAPPPPDTETSIPQGEAMRTMASLAARRPSRLSRWFWGTLAALVALVAGILFWEFATGLVSRTPILGWLVTGVAIAFVLAALAVLIREVTALVRLGNLDSFRHTAEEIRASGDLAEARHFTARIEAFFKGRDDVAWGQARLDDHRRDVVDADTLLDIVERDIVAGLDARAIVEIEAAARQVATITALVPLALADVVAALVANLRMIRRIAEIYGGRGGTLGSWRLIRTVLAHLAATGAVALGDDMLGSVAGGGVLSKLSRRFGEGLVNGALTARVGVAALEVCRPLPYHAVKRPSVTALVRRALTGIFSDNDKEAAQ
ncbi:MAG: TIGR01620 family protein [Pseudomonadota bacterium]